MTQLIANSSLSRMSARLNPLVWLPSAIVAVLSMSWPQRLACAGGTAVAMCMAWIGLTPSPRSLPASYVDRAPLFAAAWARGDQKTMLQFIRPSDEAQFRQWLAGSAVPSSLATLPLAERSSTVESYEQDDADGATVTVRFSSQSAGRDDGGGGLTQKQLWTYAEGAWFFVPRMLASADDAVSRPVNVISPTAAVGRAGITSYAMPSMTSADSSDDDETLRPRQSSGNVVVPSSVPPWKRAR